ncbi:MAG: methyltransferase, partial [Rhizobacter sp.]|nr:methyltransferase [Rhizobacter sp.]
MRAGGFPLIDSMTDVRVGPLQDRKVDPAGVQAHDAPAHTAKSRAHAVQPRDADARARFFELLRNSLASGALVKVILARHHGAQPADLPPLVQVLVRPISLRGVPQLSFVYRHSTRDVTKNLAVADGVRVIGELLGASFKNAHLLTPTQEIQIAYSKKDKATLRIGKRDAGEKADAATGSVDGAGSENDAALASSGGAPAPEIMAFRPSAGTTTVDAPSTHDRQKHRLLDLDRPFLEALGVTDVQQRLVPSMSRKWKQINKFVEVFGNALAASSLADADAVHVADFGSGKGYLTFAVHDYLGHVLGKSAQVTGVELRQDMVTLCESAARRLHLDGLAFALGDVAHYTPDKL